VQEYQAFPTDLPELKAITTALRRPLPGWRAHLPMAPHPRPVRPDLPEDHQPRRASVLLLFYPAPEGLCLPLTLRTDRLEYHRGQISLPGGMQEGEETLAETALREAEEELGIPAVDVTLLGRLSPLYVPPSDFCIAPFVAWYPEFPRWRPDPTEVAQILEVPLALLRDPRIRDEEIWEREGRPVRVPFFRIYSYIVWGATAMILNEFLSLLDDLPLAGEEGMLPEWARFTRLCGEALNG